MSEEDRRSLATSNSVGPGTFLVDGFVGGTWTVERDGSSADLLLHPLDPDTRSLPDADRVALKDEGAALLSLLAPDASSREVRFVTG